MPSISQIDIGTGMWRRRNWSEWKFLKICEYSEHKGRRILLAGKFLFFNKYSLRQMLAESSFVISIMKNGNHSIEAYLPEPRSCHIGDSFIPIRGALSLVPQALIVLSLKRTNYLAAHLAIGYLAKHDSVHVQRNVRKFFFRSMKKESYFSHRHQSMG
jgi:hypothetical protein